MAPTQQAIETGFLAMITDINDANELILRRISETPGKTILGFLALSEMEQDALLSVVREALQRPPSISIRQLLRTRPGAACYALMLARSISKLPGGQFWPCVEEQLDVRLFPADQHTVANDFQLACSRIGVLDGTIDNVGWVNAAPFIFQAGILHYWRTALADGLRRTLKVLPAPDLEDDTVVLRFVAELGRHIVNQPILSRTLETEIGPLLVRRLVIAFLKNDDSVLPPHLRTPMRESFQTTARGAVLRSPYLAFDPAFGELELVLPAQNTRIATPDTYWMVERRRYPGRSETRIPITDLSQRQCAVSLHRLSGTYQDQDFQIDARLDETVPFRVFREDTLRERRTTTGTSSLPPGDYLVLIAPEVDAAEDDDGFSPCEGYRIYRNLQLRPGDNPVELQLGERRWRIGCDLQTGIFANRNRLTALRLEGGELLHYGPSVGLVGYFPASADNDPDFQLTICCAEQGFTRTGRLASGGENNRVYVFTENLRNPLSAWLKELAPGIHRIELALIHANRRVEHRFWYWRGLDGINESRGFACSEFPNNLDLGRCAGVAKVGNTLAFRGDYHRPFIRLALASPGTDLVLPRPGVQAVLISPGEDWEEEPNPDQPVIVSRDDKRVLRFRSGGFQRWEIRCGNAQVGLLDTHRSSFAISLAGVCQTYGGSGSLIARREDGKEVKLLSFAMPLTATSPEFTQNHGMALEEWAFDVPTEDLFEVAVRLTDLSDEPDAPAASELILTSVTNAFEDTLCELSPGLSILTRQVERSGTGFIHLTVTLHPNLLHDRFLLLDFMRRGSVDVTWVPLRCVERHGYALLRIVVMGSATPNETSTWWRRLRSARRTENAQRTDPSLAQALEALSVDELNKGLITCRQLLGWKYPKTVWDRAAIWFQDFPIYLGRHRFNIHDHSAAAWWEQSATELCEHAAGSVTPVVKQFLLGSQPNGLRIPPARMEGSTRTLSASPLGRSLILGKEIQAAGGLLSFIRNTYHSNQVDRDVFHAFQGFASASRGQGTSLGGFGFKKFLETLFQRSDEVWDNTARIVVESLLSPEHLLVSVRSINRRCHLLGAASDNPHGHALENLVQSIARVHQNLDQLMPAVSRELGIAQQFEDPYDAGNFVFWWKPPCLANPWGQKIAEITWALTAIARLTANQVINPQQFQTWLEALFGASNERKIQNGVCTLLSLAPELFAFYVGLFDVAFAETAQN